ncbi:hypothetical protein [Limnohabitans sp. 2KL-3]|uniref:hypothetical protein n=1 Tax=Limnohabitans sp. 2KL-3 TaxID=1100700 RepID=UPI001892A14D|nr:hypothetical protein [Limnohabitans sp. 2KL-3]
MDLTSQDEVEPVIQEIFNEAKIKIPDVINKLNYTLRDAPYSGKKTYFNFFESILDNSASGANSMPTLYADRPELILPYLLITSSIFAIPLIVIDISNMRQIEKTNQYADFGIPIHVFENLECIEVTEDVWQQDLRNDHFDLPRDRRYGSIKKSVLLNILEKISPNPDLMPHIKQNEKYDEFFHDTLTLRKRFNNFLYIHSSGLETDKLRFFIEGMLKHRSLSMGLKIPENSKIVTNFKKRHNYYSGIAIRI